MTEDRLPWFHCYPAKLLNAIASMKPDQKLVYMVLLLRIYDVRGPLHDTLDAIALRCGINRRRTTEAIDALFKADKLLRVDGGIHNPFALKVLADGNARHEKRVRAGAAAASSRAGKGQQKQQTPPSNAQAIVKQEDLDLDSDSEKEVKKVKPPPESTERATARKAARRTLPDDWKPTGQDFAYAASKGFALPRAREMAAEFFDHHRSKGTLILDLPATWRTWCRNELKFAQRRGGPPRESRNGPAALAVRRAMEMFGGGNDDDDAASFERDGVVPTGATRRPT